MLTDASPERHHEPKQLARLRCVAHDGSHQDPVHNSMTSPYDRLGGAYASIRERTDATASIALVLGSGLGGLADQLRINHRIPYADITGFPHSAAPGHAGDLLHGEMFGVPVWMMHGRFHLYEGWSAEDVALAPRLLAALGAQTLIVTNAAGALNPDYRPGDVMVIRDHINLTGCNPLIGPDEPRLGLRFPDMSQAYSPALADAATAALTRVSGEPQTGVYLGVSGPSLETSAERRFYRTAGADAIGMSTVVEVIAAVQANLRVLGLSAITNMATGGPDQQPDTIEDVLAHAATAGDRITRAFEHLLPRLAKDEG